MGAGVIIYLIAGAAAGGFVNGLAGFGTALFALGFFLTVMPPVQAVAVVLVLSVATGLPGLWLVRHAIAEKPRRLFRVLLPALVGIPFGVQILSVIDATYLKLLIAGFLVLYGGFFSLRRTLPRFEEPKPAVDGLVGFAGGVLGGAASLSGALPTMWFAMRPWPKTETRAVLQPFNVVVLSIAVVVLALKGVYTGQTLIFLAVCLPVALCAAQAGVGVFKRLGNDQFRRVLILLSFASGLLLMVQELV